MQPSHHSQLDRQLLDAAIAAATEVRDRAHAPYSKFQVGAALIDEDGSLFVGCNVENASYGLTVCAERNAVAHAVASGAQKIVVAVIVAGTPTPTLPCGACRQVLSEFNSDMKIVAVNMDGIETHHNLPDLLPHAFTKSSL